MNYEKRGKLIQKRNVNVNVYEREIEGGRDRGSRGVDGQGHKERGR